MRFVSVFSAALLTLVESTLGHPAARESNATSSTSTLTVALVRAAPANWPSPLLNKNWTGVSFDLNATVAYGAELIAQAASNGAKLVVFPELWFPGYPKGIDDAWIASPHAADYIENSLTVGSSEWLTLLNAAKQNDIYVALAFSEKTNQSIFMGQALVSRYGEVLHKRHKVRPSGIERSLWSDGDMSGLQVLNMPSGYGRWGLLECWEHFHPTMTFPMQAQLEDLHIASFPYTPDYGNADALYWESAEVNAAAARIYAVNSGAVTLFASVGYSAVFDGEGLEVTSIKASVPCDEQPLLYASINATAFSNEAYDVDGEQSWGVLKEIEGNWPYYVPKVRGEYVDKKTILIQDLLAKE